MDDDPILAAALRGAGLDSNGTAAHGANGKRRPGRGAPDPSAADAELPHETDRGNATRLVQRNGDYLRYVAPWKRFLYFDGRRWEADDTGEPMRRAKDTVAALYRDTAATIASIGRDLEQATDDSARAALTRQLNAARRLLAWALRSEAEPRLQAMLRLIHDELPIRPGDLDVDPMFLNVFNGTIDLRTGTLRPHQRGDFLTKLCPTPFDPLATCPRWERTLDTIFDGDGELVEYVQRFLGYALTGDVREQTLPVWWGAGANGKSTIINAILETIGSDYAGTVPPELLMETRADQHPTILADLFAKRLMVAAETGQGRRLNEARLKMLTGGERIKARRMRENLWEFSATHKLVLVTNHRPEVRGTDHAIWRRLRLVPFAVRFLDRTAPANADRIIPEHLRIDRDLPAALRAERPGILAWLVRGCLDWQRYGLPCPSVVRGASEEYRAAEDRLGAFIAERCSVGPDYRAKATELWGAYRTWCEATGERQGTATAFGLALAERGFQKDAGKRWYLGIALNDPED